MYPTTHIVEATPPKTTGSISIFLPPGRFKWARARPAFDPIYNELSGCLTRTRRVCTTLLAARPGRRTLGSLSPNEVAASWRAVCAVPGRLPSGWVVRGAAMELQRRSALQRRQLERRYPTMLRAHDQPRLLEGDLVISNFGGMRVLRDFRHAALVVRGAAPSTANGELVAKVAGCRWKGCSVESLQYPQDATAPPVDRRGVDAHERRGLHGRHFVWVVRYVGPDRTALVRSAVKIATRWAGEGGLALDYRFHVPSLIKSACLGRPDAERARRYMTAALEGPTDQVAGMICSEFAVAVWLAALGLRYDGPDLESVLGELLPVQDARGCWPHNIWRLGEHPHWQQVGVISDAFTWTVQGQPAGYDE